ncbi:hypothetical protein VE00_06301 [Pseudogymnoascus sp. WSF 3629]|nr:hypothetical protein VE00_06301 [Pseudogymnoascus sp. WSF 3629]
MDADILFTDLYRNMFKRTRDDLDFDLDSDSGGDNARPQRKRKRAPPKLPQPLYKAVVKDLAESGTIRVSSSTADIDNTILERIKKCLDRANHPGTPEAEAKVALHRASRLMGQYNVTQAEVLAHEPPSAQRNYAGQSNVEIVRVDGDIFKSVKHQNYVNTLLNAISLFFDCKSYSTTYNHYLKLTFYGIAQNTVTAALSFEMVYNLITEWARPHRGTGPRNSHTIGASDGLYKMAKKRKADELAEAKKAEKEATEAKIRQEELERQAQLDRLAPHVDDEPVDLGSPEPAAPAYEPSEASSDENMTDYEDSVKDEPLSDSELPGAGRGVNAHSPIMIDEDSRDDCAEPDFKVEGGTMDDIWGDLNDEIDSFIRRGTAAPAPNTEEPSHTSVPEKNPGASPDVDQEPESKWASQMQLDVFRATATKIADEYLNRRGVKLMNGRIRSNVIRDRNAYKQGERDGKKIDVHRKTIKERVFSGARTESRRTWQSHGT